VPDAARASHRRVRPARLASECSASEKVELVLRLLAGEPIGDVARESRRPQRQLSAWKKRFLAGGEESLSGQVKSAEIDLLRAARQREDEEAEELAIANRLLERRLRLLCRQAPVDHPTTSAAYAHAQQDPETEALEVPEWETYVLVRASASGLLQATGLKPLAGLRPGGDMSGGLERLRDAGVRSVSLVTDPMWCPELHVLTGSFGSCRQLKTYYLVDREAKQTQIRKRHRNRINRASRAAEVRKVSLSDHLDVWFRLHEENVRRRQIQDAYSREYFERLAEMGGLETVAVIKEGRFVTMTLWFRHEDVLYYREGASSEEGFEISASYGAFAYAIQHAAPCSYVFLGGSVGMYDDHRDGMATFRRGFANATVPSYLCSATLT
jgi:Acetyltransferase (GNAT) domain/Helix-turn-helix domain